MEKGLGRGLYSTADMERAISILQLTTHFHEAVLDADFVIEAVPEDIKLKTDIFQKLDHICKPHVILATNTSTMSQQKWEGLQIGLTVSSLCISSIQFLR
jgi:3-hydroxybutyryl-CoA dehydrogenase